MKQSGHTLLELMVVVGIIAVLVAIAVPSYAGYQARARQTEAAIMLASLHTAEMSYFAQHGTFSPILNGEGGIGWKPQGYKGGGSQEDFYYTYGFNVPGAQEGIHYFTGKLNTPKESLGSTIADKQQFSVGAAAHLITKEKIDVWQIDQNRKLNHISDGIN